MSTTRRRRTPCIRDRSWARKCVCILLFATCAAFIHIHKHSLSGFLTACTSSTDHKQLKSTKNSTSNNSTSTSTSTSSVPLSLSEDLGSIPTGWGDEKAADWIQALCPSVVEHFNRFPSFAYYTNFSSSKWGGEPFPLPYQTTAFAAKTVCTFQIAEHLAASVNAKLFLHAGSHLGAVLHGQPIPWDDDADAFMDWDKKDAFYQVCNSSPQLEIYPGVTVHCHLEEEKVLKLWIQQEGEPKTTPSYRQHNAPYLDLFFYQLDYFNIWEVGKPNDGYRIIHKWPIADYFPVVPYYFGGIVVYGPRDVVAKKRYKFDICVLPNWNHRLERQFENYSNVTKMDCQILQQKFPFRTAYNQLSVGSQHYPIFGVPESDSALQPQTLTTIADRYSWSQQEGLAVGQTITNQLPHLNEVEIDNTISPSSECITNNNNNNNNNTLKVIEFNAERGRWWKEAAPLLQGYDVILLNEMDWGMARSDQQHTTRNLAHYLQMNYAFGMEFIELTLGDANDREGVVSQSQNMYGLHGNAILTKCPIADPKIFRDDLGQYFSNEKLSLNAQGMEKRLGGRMGLFGRIQIGNNDKSLVVGSIHRTGFGTLAQQIRTYIGSNPAVVAGDIEGNYCREGLQLDNQYSDPNHNTWRATCSSTGFKRGDNICSNLDLVQEDVILPCIDKYDQKLLLSDHAFTWAEFKL